MSISSQSFANAAVISWVEAKTNLASSPFAHDAKYSVP